MRSKTDSLLIIVFTLIILSVVTVFQISLGNITGYAAGGARVCVGNTPYLVYIGNLSAPTRAVYTYDVNHTMSGDDAVSYSDNADPFDIAKTSGIISFTPQDDQVGNYTIVISVNNSVCPVLGDREELGFEIKTGNWEPVLDPIANQTVWEDGYCTTDIECDENGNCWGTGFDHGFCPVSLTLSATDPDGDNVTYSCNDTTYFTVNETTGLIEWTPDWDDVGLHWFTCYATDDYGAYDSEEFFVRVRNTNDEPILDEISNFTVEYDTELYEDVEWKYDVNATDPDEDNITYSDNTDLFPNIGETTGVIEFTPTASQVGNYSVRIYADDGIGPGHAEQLVLFEIIPVNDIPELAYMGFFSVAVGSELCGDANVTDVEDGDDTGENLNFTFTDDTDLFDINFTGGFCFAPNETQIGNYTVNISVTDTGIPDYEITNATIHEFVTIYVTEMGNNTNAPGIISYSPRELHYTRTGLEVKTPCVDFNITASDPEGGNITVYWYLDGILVNTTGPYSGTSTHSYELCTYTCPAAYNLTAIVSDGELETPLEWVIVVEEPCESGVVGHPPSAGEGAITKYHCKETWVCTDWSTCMINDIQLRVCKDIRECGAILNKPPELRSCIFTPVQTCFDRIRNQDEILPDCGGICNPCPTCNDGICNQGELCSICDTDTNRCPRDLGGNIMVDCGGPCPLCPKIERVVQPKITTWKTTALTIIKISLIILFIIIIGLIVTIRVIRYVSKKAVLTETEKAELDLVNKINYLITYAEKAIDMKDLEQLKLICANIEELYNRLSSTKNKKKIYPKIERLKKAIRIGF